MAGVVKRTRFVFESEILRSAAGLDDVKSMVLDATKVNTTFSGVAGRYIVPMGSVLVKSGAKVAPLFMNDGTTDQGALMGTGGASAYVAGDIVGILSRTVELLVGDGAPDSKSDVDVSVLHFNCDFDISKLVGYNPAVDLGNTVPAVDHGIDNSTIVKSALPHCLFR